MADINVKGRYRVLTYEGTTPFDFTSYSNQLCSIRTPNPVTFVTISQYIPGGGQSFTSFQPGSSYTIVTKSNTAEFTMGDYTRGDRLPSSVNMRFPNFYYGLDRNSINVPLSNYALSVNSPLSTVFTYIPNQQGYFNNIASFNVERFKQGLSDNLTHLSPGSSYQFRNRTNYTLFAPLESEMGDAWATGKNDFGQIGMGYQYNSYGFTQLYGTWDKVVISDTHAAALSTCGTKKKLFVCGSNDYGQLGLTPVVGSSLQRPVTATQTVWREITQMPISSWDHLEGSYYFYDLLSYDSVVDVEVGNDFTLVRMRLYNEIYGIGRMANMGIAPPGGLDPDGFIQFDPIYNTQGTTSVNTNFIPYWTKYLRRPVSNVLQSPDNTLYDDTYNNIAKFQARGPRWYYLLNNNRLYGAGKIAGFTSGSSPVVLPIGFSNTPTTSYVSNFEIRCEKGNSLDSTRNGRFLDFEAGRSNIVALSSNFKNWFIGGAVSQNTSSNSLSTICFFDSTQNAYISQQDYGLKLYPLLYGCVGILGGKIYYNGQPAFNNGALYGVGNINVSSLLPSTTLPKLNNALSPNPEERVYSRSLTPATYLGQPNTTWKSLFAQDNSVFLIDNNNKLYACGSNTSGIVGLPIDTTLLYSLCNVITDNVFNANVNGLNNIIYKTNRNPAPSFTPQPSFTPTPTPTITPTRGAALPYNTGNILYNFYQEGGVTVSGSTKRIQPGETSRGYWYNDIGFSNAVPFNIAVNGVYPYKMNYYSLEYTITDLPQYQQYNKRTGTVARIESKNFNSRICTIFTADPIAPSTGNKKPLCFSYFSQNHRPDIPTTSIYSKHAPLSGIFGDNRNVNQPQRVAIDTNNGDFCLKDFYISPETNKYYVVFTKYIDASISNRTDAYNTYYSYSVNQGATWASPQLIGNTLLLNNSYPTYTNPDSDILEAQQFFSSPCITNKPGNLDRPAILYLENGTTDERNPTYLRCKYSINSPLDRTHTLALGYKRYFDFSDQYRPGARAHLDPTFSHSKILYDNNGRLITLWTGTPGVYNSTNSGGRSLWSSSYTGPGPNVIIYSYGTPDPFYGELTWSTPVTACRTFPRNRNWAVSNWVYWGRYWDACIDNENNLCIVHTPTVALKNTSTGGVQNLLAFTANVIKININSGQTIFNEQVIDITSIPSPGPDPNYYPKTIGTVNVYYDTQIDKLVAQFFVHNTSFGDGFIVQKYRRNGNNNWSLITPANPYNLDINQYNLASSLGAGAAWQFNIQQTPK